MVMNMIVCVSVSSESVFMGHIACCSCKYKKAVLSQGNGTMQRVPAHNDSSIYIHCIKADLNVKQQISNNTMSRVIYPIHIRSGISR